MKMNARRRRRRPNRRLGFAATARPGLAGIARPGLTGMARRGRAKMARAGFPGIVLLGAYATSTPASVAPAAAHAAPIQVTEAPLQVSEVRPRGKLLFSASPAVWFEGFRTPALISSDGRLAIYRDDATGGPGILDLGTGRPAPGRVWSGLDAVHGAAFGPGGVVALRGVRGGESGWFLPGPGGPRRLSLPPDAVPRWSPAGEHVAFFHSRAPDRGLFVSGPDGERVHPVEGRITHVAWHPNGRSLVVMVVDRHGVSSVVRIQRETGEVETIAENLDASPYASPVPIAIVPDGSRAFVALASPGVPDPDERHRANADRDLDIHELDLETGSRRAVVATPADEFAPAIVDGRLYWTVSAIESSIVVVPRRGGPGRLVVEDAMLPTWRPDGRMMGFTYGGWRAADWVLNWEGGVVEVDTAGGAVSPPGPYITGYHEDFSPVWSPDGRWVAYHSHRSPAPVFRYAGPGSADDIFLRRAGAATEIRLTDFGEEVGPPDWAPDGTRLVFTGWVDDEGPVHSGAWIVTVERATGRPTGHRRLPLPEPIRGARNAAWSPGGDEIAIAAPSSAGRQALWIVPLDGSAPRRIVEYRMPTYGGLDWTPGGDTLVFPAVSGGRMQLYEVPAAGGEPRRLTEADANLLHPSVSPDGRWIAATRIVHRREIRRAPLP